MIVIVTAPWTVVRAALTTVFLAPLALMVALPAAVGVGHLHPGAGRCPARAAGRRAPPSRSTASAPGRAAPRGSCAGCRARSSAARAALTVAFISSWALALAVVSSAFSQPPLIWPATSSTIPHLLPGLPSLGGTLHSLQKWLLGNTVGMLHLP